MINSTQFSNDQVFHHWLVGCYEADGCFSINLRGEFRFDLYQHSIDADLLAYIKTRLQCGNVHKRSNRDMCIYTVYSIKHFISILYPIFNKKILSEVKFNQFKKVCEKAGLVAERGDHSHLAWLTGFIDGDGSFFLSITDSQISAIFSLGQKEREILDIICSKFFKNRVNVNGGSGIGARKSTYYILRMSCRSLEFVNSFMQYNLLTKKRLDYLKWCQAVELIQLKKHLTPEGRAKIIELHSGMSKTQ